MSTPPASCRPTHLIEEKAICAADLEQLQRRKIVDQALQGRDPQPKVQFQALFLSHIVEVFLAMKVISPIKACQLGIGDCEIGRDHAALLAGGETW
jgi:hypothetical protein